MIATIEGKSRQTVSFSPQTAYVFPSELGWLGLEYRGELVTRLTFGHPSSASAAATFPERTTLATSERDLPVPIQQTVERLQRFAAGTDDDFLNIPIDLSHLTDFQRRVVKACRKIKAGQTKSYADLAAIAGSPRAARAVGNVMRSNRYPLIVPCHRVIGSNGKLCGFTSPQGLAMKEKLLTREGSMIATKAK
jgi:methylated-DNA-[protein]-cysteine S-methyltransferase